MSIFSIKVICLGYHLKDVGKELKGNNSLGVESNEKVFYLGGSLTSDFCYGLPLPQAGQKDSLGRPLRKGYVDIGSGLALDRDASTINTAILRDFREPSEAELLYDLHPSGHGSIKRKGRDGDKIGRQHLDVW